MIRSFGLSVALLSIALLFSSSGVSAGIGGPLVTTPATTTAQLNPIISAVNPSQFLTMAASSVYMRGDDGNKDDDDKDRDRDRDRDKDKDKDKDKDRDKDKDKDKDHHDHDPTPEPSTILSFGAALLIGGGVLYSRRLRGSKK